MSMPDDDHRKASPRVLVAIASYGTSNDRYLELIIREYQSMPFDIDIVVVSNIEKKLAAGVECLVGLPNKNPWSLPFAHKKLFVENLDRYDLFIYSEDDILITEQSLRAWLELTPLLRQDEVAGFLRVELGADGEPNYPDAHAHFHWDPSSAVQRGGYTLAYFTNEHAACYVLDRTQLGKALSSGGFDVKPHEGKYDLLCTAATDPYTQCGFTKLIPISHLDEFTVHHMSNRYVGRMGVTDTEFRKQTDVLLQIAQTSSVASSLLPAETKLWRGAYSKNYYEPVSWEMTSLIPKSTRSVLSIGCGWGATEGWLAETGVCVSAIPLDSVISHNAAERGVEIIDGSLISARARLDERRFDCILFLNVLHLIREPVEVLSLFSDLLSPASPIIIQSPNMSNIPALWRQLRNRRLEMPLDYGSAGAHFSFRGRIEKWCKNAGLTTEKTIGVLHPRAEPFDAITPGIARLALASDIISVARKNA
jgi:2-polyprenyl-3-methyl-5-hydroxy-6-metoxy-1,4-benzoquinol methylase